MSEIKIHVFHTGKVCVSPELPFGGEGCSIFKASGVFAKKDKRLWLPVSAYLIEIDNKLVLFDCGWHRDMSPEGAQDTQAQIASLGCRLLYNINQGHVPQGQTIDEQLSTLGISPKDLDIVLLSHLDCDHANGLKLVKDAKKILVSADELHFAENNAFINRIRYQQKWWEDTRLETFRWNGCVGPANKSYDVFGDGKLLLVNIPGHSKGQCALKITNLDGKFVLLFADGGYASKSWQEMITSGIADDKQAQKNSLQWIREQSLSPDCIESLANHDAEVKPHVIEF